MIIGHSFGGLITEKLLGQGYGAAGVAIDPAQIKGVLPLPLAQLRSGLPALGNPANLHRAVSLTEKEFRFGFGNALTEEESDELYEAVDDPLAGPAAVPGGGRELRAALAGEGRHRQPDSRPAAADLGHRGPHRARRRHPLHLQAVPGLDGGHRLKQFEGRGHSLTIDNGWRDVAEAVLDWLKNCGI